MQDFKEIDVAAPQPCRRRKAAGWHTFLNSNMV